MDQLIGSTVIVAPLWGGTYPARLEQVVNGFAQVVRLDDRFDSVAWVLVEQIVATWPQEVWT
jgi:hypothetical protein